MAMSDFEEFYYLCFELLLEESSTFWKKLIFHFLARASIIEILLLDMCLLHQIYKEKVMKEEYTHKTAHFFDDLQKFLLLWEMVPFEMTIY